MSLRSFQLQLLTAMALTGFSAGSAQALNIDFEDYSHGQVVTDANGGVSISALNPNRDFNIAAAFDTNARNTRDYDLESNHSAGSVWTSGNLAQTDLGLILILQENDQGCSTGVCSAPDDEGQRPAGSLTFALGTPVLDFGFDLVDMESVVAENATIEFFDGTDSATVSVMDYLDMTSARYDPTIVLGDNSANRFQAITAQSVGLDQFDRIEFNLGGSGGLDNLVGTPVPEPGAALLIGLGLGVLSARRRSAV